MTGLVGRIVRQINEATTGRYRGGPVPTAAAAAAAGRLFWRGRRLAWPALWALFVAGASWQVLCEWL